jgi:amino acid transporter
LTNFATEFCSGQGHKAQGIDRSLLPYWNPLQPGLAIWGVFWTSIFILVNGYQVFFVWNTQNFLTAYINTPIFFGLWIGWTLYMRTPFWRAHEMDFVTVHSSLAQGFLQMFADSCT